MKAIKTYIVKSRTFEKVPENCLVSRDATKIRNDVVEVYTEIGKGEGYVNLPWDVKSVKAVKVFKTRKAPEGEIGNIQIITDDGAIVLGHGGENRADEINDVIKAKGYAEIDFHLINRSVKIVTYNIGHLGLIRNA